MTKNTNSVLVTGGAGYVGSHVCKALSDAGYRPVTYDNLSRGFRDAVKWGPFECGDLNDAGKIQEVLINYSPIGVIHLAGYAYVGESVEQPDLYQANNVDGAQVLIDTVLEKGANPLPIVFSSTCSIYGDQGAAPLSENLPSQPMNPYAEGKLRIEIMLAEAERRGAAPFIALRYFNAAGADPMAEIGESHDPETHIIPLLLEVAAGRREEFVVFGDDHDTADGSCIRDYVHVADLATAHVAALRHLLGGGASDIINLANGRGYSVFEVIDAVRRITGKDVKVRHGNKRAGDPAVLVGDARRASEVLNWVPQYSGLDAQISHAWAWFQSGHKAAS